MPDASGFSEVHQIPHAVPEPLAPAITVILPDGPQLQFKVLGNAEAVQRWYIEFNREVIAKKGKDYIGDKSRWFWFGDHGNLFKPGIDRSV